MHVTDARTRTWLGDLTAGALARVVDVVEPGALGERLLEMGLTRGTEVRVVRRGLNGCPVQLSLRGYTLSIRRAQAERIAIEKVA